MKTLLGAIGVLCASAAIGATGATAGMSPGTHTMKLTGTLFGYTSATQAQPGSITIFVQRPAMAAFVNKTITMSVPMAAAVHGKIRNGDHGTVTLAYGDDLFPHPGDGIIIAIKHDKVN